MYVSRLPAHQGAGQYYDSLTAEIAALLDAAHGHALVLFTSYAAMSAVKERLREQDLAYPLFTLGRNAVHTTKQFKNTPGASYWLQEPPGRGLTSLGTACLSW